MQNKLILIKSNNKLIINNINLNKAANFGKAMFWNIET